MNIPLIRYIFQNQFLTTLVVIFFAWIIYELRSIVIGVFISYILMSALIPWVRFLRSKRFTNSLAVATAYFVTLAFLILLIFPLIPFFTAQLESLVKSFPRYVDQTAQILGLDVTSSQIRNFFTTEFDEIGKNAFALTSTLFSGLFFLLSILVISFYFLLNHDRVDESILSLFPKTAQKKVSDTLSQIEEKLGAWLRGQIVLSLFIGFITWVALTILNIEFALPLALIAGLLEIAPTIGPIISAIPAVIVALSISPTMALIVAGVYTVIQIIENNVLVPRIMEKAVGLNPLVILIGVIAGGKLLGIAGALLAIPFISMLVIVFNSFKTERG